MNNHIKFSSNAHPTDLRLATNNQKCIGKKKHKTKIIRGEEIAKKKKKTNIGLLLVKQCERREEDYEFTSFVEIVEM